MAESLINQLLNPHQRFNALAKENVELMWAGLKLIWIKHNKQWLEHFLNADTSVSDLTL